MLNVFISVLKGPSGSKQSIMWFQESSPGLLHAKKKCAQSF